MTGIKKNRVTRTINGKRKGTCDGMRIGTLRFFIRQVRLLPIVSKKKGGREDPPPLPFFYSFTMSSSPSSLVSLSSSQSKAASGVIAPVSTAWIAS